MNIRVDSRDEDLASRIGRWATTFEPSDARRARIRASIRDFFGCVVGGVKRPELGHALRLAHPGTVPVWGLTRTFDAAGAALVAGTAGSLLQLHDLHVPAGLHPSSPVIPSAWAALHCGGRRGGDFVRAVAAGYEAANRIGLACAPAQVLAGGTATASAGSIGAAVSAALLTGLDARGVARAVRNATLLLPLAPFASMLAHGELAPLHSGLAARAGVEAALLAPDADVGEWVLEGHRGAPGAIALFRGDAARIVPEGWDGATLDDVAWKFFPACFGSITALEAILRLGAIDATTLRSLQLRLPDRMLALVAGGPDSGHLYDRLMSLRWAAARSILSGSFGPADVGRDGPQVMALARKIEIIHDAGLDSLTDELAADVEMTTADGRTRRIAYRRAKGKDPDSPGPRGWTHRLDEAALREKFQALAGTDPVHEATLLALA